jgi:cytochrome oxidase assembly protein ShyY1
MTVAFAVACVALGQWQFARRAEAQAAIALLNANFDKSSSPVSEVIPSFTDSDTSRKWTPITMTGHYLSDKVYYARNRVSDGGIGFEQLVMFRDDTSRAVLLIDRGWVAANDNYSAPQNPPAVPSSTLTITARLMPSEQTIDGRSAPDGQIATIHVPTLAGLITFQDSSVYANWYARVDTESVKSTTGTPWEKPVLDEGPHLSYALQWYVFAVMGFIGYGWALRREAKGPVVEEPSKPRTARQQDEDFEDAAVDARKG